MIGLLKKIMVLVGFIVVEACAADINVKNNLCKPSVDYPCENARNQRELTSCWSEEASKLDKEVQKQSADIDAQMLSISQNSLGQAIKNERNKWSDFVESHCEQFNFITQGGSLAPLGLSICRWRLAQQRIQQLKMLQQEINQK